jgi:Amt family ammonium transporter
MVTASQFADLVSNITSLQATLSALSDKVATNQADSNSFYLLWAGAIVFLMQAGFATLSAGSIRQKNVKNILLKNLLDACCGALSWYFIGYGFAYPGTDTGNAFIGLTGSAFALGNIDDTVEGYASTTSGTAWISWYFQFAFAAAAATIVSGAVAERCALSAYLIYTLFITGFIYPVVVHWVWDSNGWLSAWNSKPVGGPILPCIDFAGSGVVHMTGGFAAMVGAKILGPRLGRFENPAAFEGHSTPLVIIGLV